MSAVYSTLLSCATLRARSYAALKVFAVHYHAEPMRENLLATPAPK